MNSGRFFHAVMQHTNQYAWALFERVLLHEVCSDVHAGGLAAIRETLNATAYGETSQTGLSQKHALAIVYSLHRDLIRSIW
jgi:hypothetical protein